MEGTQAAMSLRSVYVTGTLRPALAFAGQSPVGRGPPVLGSMKVVQLDRHDAPPLHEPTVLDSPKVNGHAACVASVQGYHDLCPDACGSRIAVSDGPAHDLPCVHEE